MLKLFDNHFFLCFSAFLAKKCLLLEKLFSSLPKGICWVDYARFVACSAI